MVATVDGCAARRLRHHGAAAEHSSTAQLVQASLGALCWPFTAKAERGYSILRKSAVLTDQQVKAP
jgi:hypothetical protein